MEKSMIIEQLRQVVEKIDPKQRNIVIIAIIVLFSFIICKNIIYRNAAKRTAYYESEADKENTRSALRQEILDLSGTQKGYEELILQNQDIDDFRNKLSSMAQESGIEIISINSASIVRSDFYGGHITKLELKCGYHGFGDFVSKIENMQPYAFIDKIDFSGFQTSRLLRTKAQDLLQREEIRQQKDSPRAKVSMELRTFSEK